MRDLIGSGAPANRDGLLRALRLRGHQDVGAPGYDADIAKLRAATIAELARLMVHSLLPVGGGIPIVRESDGPLAASIEGGSLLIVGEPGAGKTGALVNAARHAIAAGHVVVFLSVDRFPGIAIAADLVTELGLAHPIVDVLEAIPGAGRKILVIDALDAARGGSAEGVFAALIEDVRVRLQGDWTVAASIRTFDLKNGRRFRQAFAGAPADPDHADRGLEAVRHFLVPRLSAADLARAGEASTELAGLLASAPLRLTELLRNIFNLSLAAQLLTDGTAANAFSAIRTQSGLIDAYEDVRLDTTTLQQAAAAAVNAMASRRRLSIRKVVIANLHVDAVIRRGVLAETGDLVSFAHHVLFDHVAGRFHLAWDDSDALITQLQGDTSTALLLSPALRFAVERMWRADGVGRPLSWKLVASIFSATSIDPVLATVALRIAVENVTDETDIAGLAARITGSSAEPALARMLGGLARFATMDIEAVKSVGASQVLAWARLAARLIATRERALVDPARVLLHALFEYADFQDPDLLSVFGSASRALLELAWSTDPPLMAMSVNAIRFIGKSFASNPAASRMLLDQILREPHFSLYGDREATWLAEQIVPITLADPEFTVVVYGALYGQMIDDSAASWLGGQPSRIMPLSSNRRQDYEHCRWQLGTAMSKVLAIAPDHGTRALIESLIGKSLSGRSRDTPKPDQISLGDRTIEFRGFQIDLNAWDDEDESPGSQDDNTLKQFVAFLRQCDIDTFTTSVNAASRDYATGSVWARIFGVGAERVEEIGDLLWPLVERPDFIEHQDTLRDAIRYVAAAWPSRSRLKRIHFETMALDEKRFSQDDDRIRWRQILGRVFNLIPEAQLELQVTRLFRQELVADELLTENEPLRSLKASWRRPTDFAREQSIRDGVDVESGPTQRILEASEALDALLKQTGSDSAAPVLATLWNAATTHLADIDVNPGMHDHVDRAAWGSISKAVERVASSVNYQPGTDGLPDLETMFAILERLSASQYPQQRETT